MVQEVRGFEVSQVRSKTIYIAMGVAVPPPESIIPLCPNHSGTYGLSMVPDLTGKDSNTVGLLMRSWLRQSPEPGVVLCNAV